MSDTMKIIDHTKAKAGTVVMSWVLNGRKRVARIGVCPKCGRNGLFAFSRAVRHGQQAGKHILSVHHIVEELGFAEHIRESCGIFMEPDEATKLFDPAEGKVL